MGADRQAGRIAAVAALASCLALFPEAARAQEAEAAADTAATTEEDGSSLIPIPVIFYQPETGVGFGASAVYLFPFGRAPDSESSQLASSLSLVAIYTTKSQIIAAARAELYPAGGENRFIGEMSYLKFPTKFWGIGNDTPEELEEDYTPVSIDLMFEGQRRLRRGWYFGLAARFAYRELTKIEEGGLLDSGLIPGRDDGRLIGAGLLLLLDTRASVWYPRSSSYHQVRAMFYEEAFGSSYDYITLTLDFRKYVTLFESHVLALRALGVGASGDPPFDLLPQLGGDVLLRGYFQGRYRDKDLLALQAEYRTPLWWKLGTVAFASAGQVAPQVSALRLDAFHGAVGFGLRFMLLRQEGVQLRADFAWGFDVESSEFYLNIGEAF